MYLVLKNISGSLSIKNDFIFYLPNLFELNKEKKNPQLISVCRIIINFRNILLIEILKYVLLDHGQTQETKVTSSDQTQGASSCQPDTGSTTAAYPNTTWSKPPANDETASVNTPGGETVPPYESTTNCMQTSNLTVSQVSCLFV